MCFIVSMKVSRNQISSANIYQIQSGQNTNHGGTLQSSAMTAIIYMNANCQKKKKKLEKAVPVLKISLKNTESDFVNNLIPGKRSNTNKSEPIN